MAEFATSTFVMNAEKKTLDYSYPPLNQNERVKAQQMKDDKTEKIEDKTEKTEEEEMIYHLGRHNHIQPNLYQGQMRVDIRHWDRDGRRTKKGISLPIPCWQALLRLTESIQHIADRIKEKEVISNYFDLSNDVYVTLTSPLWIVDIRNWYMAEDGTLKPGWRGIALRFNEFSKLLEYASSIEHNLDTLLQKRRC